MRTRLSRQKGLILLDLPPSGDDFSMRRELELKESGEGQV
jgi:hypothetical protein